MAGALAAIAYGFAAAVIAAVLPPVEDWDMATAGALAFAAGVAMRSAAILANFIAGPRDRAGEAARKRFDDRLWGENGALAGGLVALLVVLARSV